MAYAPTTDFLALLRQTSGGIRTESMPGLDYVVAALARAGMFQLSVGQTPPTVNQPITAWLKPSVPSWVAEGMLFLWSAADNQYETATPALWDALLIGVSGFAFQSAPSPANIINAGTSMLAVQRAAPAVTSLTLPPLLLQGTKPIQIVDWSTAVANHVINIGTSDTSSIMKLPAWQLLSNAAQLAGVTLYPVSQLNGWIIAP